MDIQDLLGYRMSVRLEFGSRSKQYMVVSELLYIKRHPDKMRAMRRAHRLRLNPDQKAKKAAANKRRSLRRTDEQIAERSRKSLENYYRDRDRILARLKVKTKDPKVNAGNRIMTRLYSLFKRTEWANGSYVERPVHRVLKPRPDLLSDVVGMPLPDLKARFESLFDEDMNWGNFGKVWHIGHIVPRRVFYMADPEQLRKAFHYTNIRPERARENYRRLNEVIPSP